MRPTTENRRQHKRHRLDNSVIVSSHGIFQIIDISRGGFRFKCPPATSVPNSWDTDIFALATSLKGLPAKRIWVSMSENGNHKHLPTVIGAKFGRLTKAQESQLSQFLDAISQDDDSEH